MPQKTLNSKPHVDPLQNYHYLNSKGRLLHQIIRYDGFQCNTPLKRCCILDQKRPNLKTGKTAQHFV